MQPQRHIHRRPRRPSPAATTATAPLAPHSSGDSTPGTGGSAVPSEKRVAYSGPVAALFFDLIGKRCAQASPATFQVYQGLYGF